MLPGPGKKVFALVFSAFAFTAPLSFAAGPSPQQEPYEYAEIILQRNNAQNELANVRSAWHRDSDYWAYWVAGGIAQANAQDVYWKQYLEGIETQRHDMDAWLKSYIEGVEAQRKQATHNAKTDAARAAEAARR